MASKSSMYLAVGSQNAPRFFASMFRTPPAVQVTHVKDVLPKREELTKRERGERGDRERTKAEKKKKSQAGLGGPWEQQRWG